MNNSNYHFFKNKKHIFMKLIQKNITAACISNLGNCTEPPDVQLHSEIVHFQQLKWALWMRLGQSVPQFWHDIPNNLSV